MWELLDSMASIRTHRLQPLGSKIEVTALKDAAQLDQRAALVELAAQVAAFAEGIRTIDRCCSLQCCEACKLRLRVIVCGMRHRPTGSWRNAGSRSEPWSSRR